MNSITEYVREKGITTVIVLCFISYLLLLIWQFSVNKALLIQIVLLAIVFVFMIILLKFTGNKKAEHNIHTLEMALVWGCILLFAAYIGYNILISLGVI